MTMKSRVRKRRPKCKMHTQERQFVFYNWSTKKTEPKQRFSKPNRTRGFSQNRNRTDLEKSIPHISIVIICQVICWSVRRVCFSRWQPTLTRGRAATLPTNTSRPTSWPAPSNSRRATSSANLTSARLWSCYLKLPTRLSSPFDRASVLDTAKASALRRTNILLTNSVPAASSSDAVFTSALP